MIHQNIHEIKYADKKIILVGTAHVSNESAKLVQEAIDFYAPDNICIELDKDRFYALKNPQDYKNMDLKAVIKKNQAFQVLANTILSSYQVRMAKELNSEVGLEMKTAIKMAETANIPLTLADRNVNITFKRIWRSLNLKDKSQLLSGILASLFDDETNESLDEDIIKEMLEEDVLNAALTEVRKEVPKIATILVDERDQYLAHKIKNAKGKTILAVVGGAHVQGIKNELFKEQDISKITYIPPKKPISKYLNYLFMVLILLVLLLPFLNGFQSGLRSILKFSVYSGGFAALATLIMGAHPLTILATFFSAPFAAVHPIIAVGFISASVEASLRKPKVRDVDNISEDIKSFKGWRSNRFIKALALVFVANLGSVIGQIISGSSIINSLFK